MMFHTSLRTAAVNAAIAALCLTGVTTRVDAHGYMTSPAAEFKGGVMKTTYYNTIDASSVFPGVKFDDSPQANAAMFADKFKSTEYKTLRDFVTKDGDQCGNSDDGVAAKPLPINGHVVWQNPDTGDGFVASHTGPCELWLGDTRVFQDNNCAARFPSKPAAEIPIDFGACGQNGCMLRFYWLALHEPKWQVYKNCIPLAGSSGAYDSSATTAPAAPTTSEPILSESPSPSPSSAYEAITQAPTPTKKHCATRRRRNRLRA